MLIRAANVRQFSRNLAFTDTEHNMGDPFTKANLPERKYIQLFYPGLYERDQTMYKQQTDDDTDVDTNSISPSTKSKSHHAFSHHITSLDGGTAFEYCIHRSDFNL